MIKSYQTLTVTNIQALLYYILKFTFQGVYFLFTQFITTSEWTDRPTFVQTLLKYQHALKIDTLFILDPVL